ncbi:MAG: hypothetical protein E6R03_04105 [Hyphomicrobiaceae bacterium]|nr:MAG: hypothetical protein E6R03_04105 [Hyphomicrobiaceae bacterium]
MSEQDATRKLTIVANSVHGEKEILWALRATDLVLALWDIKETFVRMRNDGESEEDVAMGARGYEIVSEAVENYGLTDLLHDVG